MESIATVLDALSTRERDLDGSPSLAGGTAGQAILHGYLAQTEGRGEKVTATKLTKLGYLVKSRECHDRGDILRSPKGTFLFTADVWRI